MNAMIPGSIQAIAAQSGRSIAETFMNADVIVIVDTSGSMKTHDSRGNRSRYDVACEELAELQRTMPGRIAVIAFSGTAVFCPSGKPTLFGGGTNLEAALRYAKISDLDGVRFIVISDGQPDDPDAALRIAKTYRNKIDTIYVGSESYPSGREFLEQLARMSGGQSLTADRAQNLLQATTTLLLKA